MFSIPKVKLNFIFTASILIVTLGFVLLMAIILPYGWMRECISDKCGIFFADRFRARDEMWHMSLARVAFDTFPFRLPIYADVSLQSYHFLFALLLNLISKIGIPVNIGYYLVFPVIWFTAYTYLTIKLAMKIVPDRRAIPIFLFFAYFSSNLSFVLSLRNKGQFWNDIGYFSNQPGEYMVNPALALSLVIFQIVILLLISPQKRIRNILILLAIFGIWGAKFYGGLIATTYVVAYLFAEYFQKKFTFRKLVVANVMIFIVCVVAVVAFYNPVQSAGRGSVFSFDPLKTIHPIIEDPELVPMRNVALARYYLYSIPKMIQPKLWLIEIFSLFLYLVFSLGTRVFGIGVFFVGKVKNMSLYIALFSSTVIGIFMSTFFVQNGSDWFNTIQFLAYSQFLMQIAVAMFTYRLFVSNKRVFQVTAFVIMIITILGALNPLAKYGRHFDLVAKIIQFDRKHPVTYISNDELSALAVLGNQPDGVVFTMPFAGDSSQGGIVNLWSTNDTAYVSVFGGHQTYISNTDQLDLMFVDYKKRYENVKNIENWNPSESNISYFYLLKNHPRYLEYLKKVKPITKTLWENSEVLLLERRGT